MNNRSTFLALLCALVVTSAAGIRGTATPSGVAGNTGGPAGPRPQVLDLAMDAAGCAIRAGDVDRPSTLTVIDYSLPSTARRLWVYDLASRRLLYEDFVAHGQGSGENYATAFSNRSGSHQSSLGLFLTAETYVGRNGYSLRLDGLEAGFNDLARERAIVVHGASYVSQAFIEANGRLGRSWGCPVVRAGLVRQLLDSVKGGGLLFVYYPDPRWLASSRYLGDCAAAADLP